MSKLERKTVGQILADPDNTDPSCRALYDPVSRKVGCVLLQAAYGGDRRPCAFWDDWQVNHVDTFVMVVAPLSQWREIARLPAAQRPGPEHFGKAA